MPNIEKRIFSDHCFFVIKPVLDKVFEFICSQSGRSDIQVSMRKSCMFVYCHNSQSTLNWHLGLSN